MKNAEDIVEIEEKEETITVIGYWISQWTFKPRLYYEGRKSENQMVDTLQDIKRDKFTYINYETFCND